jgi:hypothetical protein
MLDNDGYTVINPVCIDCLTNTVDYDTLCRLDMALLRECDAIFLLKDWYKSNGAREEFVEARNNGIKVIFEGEYKNGII